MLLSDFDYPCPAELIAQAPVQPRSSSRMLRLNRHAEHFNDAQICDLPGILSPDDLLIFNDTQVIAARLHGLKSTGGKVEILLERLLDGEHALVQMRASKTPRVNARIDLPGGDHLLILHMQDGLYKVKANRNFRQLLSEYGQVPLPPYIQRAVVPADLENYQTVFAKNPGAVAAPTAGLHFDRVLLDALAERGVHWGFFTLHGGLATFQPLRVEIVEQHKMHYEQMHMPAETQTKINHCRQRGGRVIAVGTTSVRCLESFADTSGADMPEETNLFIYPGYYFKNVDAIITNFHLPKSTLLMLVCAFAGKDKILAAYAHAIKNNYRFYSYGDAMFIE